MNYRIIGEGETVVLVHGWGVTYNLWKEIIPRLKNKKLSVVELPGMGASKWTGSGNYYDQAAQELELVRQELGIVKWQMVGYSMGSRVVEKYVQQYPKCVKSVILICPARAKKWKKWIAKSVLESRLGDWVLGGWRLLVLVWWLGFNGRRHLGVQEWYRELASQKVAVLKKTIIDLAWVDRDFDMNGVETTMLWGAKDLVMDRPQRTETIEGGHSLPIEQAKEIVARIEQIWTQ